MPGIIKLAMLAIVATQSQPALAHSGKIHSIVVRTDDIKLSTSRGQRILALRIDRAARAVCDIASDQFGHQVRKMERKCHKRAKASAQAMVKADPPKGR